MVGTSKANKRGSVARSLGTYRRPWLYAKQEAAFFNPARYSVVEASTKSGKTTAAMVWLFERAALHTKAGGHVWWLSPTFSQSRIAYRRLFLSAPRAFVRNETNLTLTLGNGVTIWFKTAEKPDNLYGEDVEAAIVDEASRCREEAWHALRSTLTATRGPVRVIGNVNGRKTWFYRLARDAETGKAGPDVHYAKITALDAVEAGVLDAAEIEDAKRRLPAPVYEELYECVPSAEGYNPFALEWFDNRRFDASDKSLLNKAIGVFQSWDTALTETSTSDYSCCVTGLLMPDYRLFIVDVFKKRLAFPALVSTIESMAAKANRKGKLYDVILEDKSSGVSAVQTLREVAPDWLRPKIKAYMPSSGKMYRASQAGVWAREGCIWLPHPSEEVPWLYSFTSSLQDFPDVEHDDDVDSLSQLAIWLEHYLSDGLKARTQAGQRQDLW